MGVSTDRFEEPAAVLAAWISHWKRTSPTQILPPDEVWDVSLGGVDAQIHPVCTARYQNPGAWMDWQEGSYRFKVTVSGQFTLSIRIDDQQRNWLGGATIHTNAAGDDIEIKWARDMAAQPGFTDAMLRPVLDDALSMARQHHRDKQLKQQARNEQFQAARREGKPLLSEREVMAKAHEIPEVPDSLGDLER